HEQVRKAAANLRRSLVQGGRLVVSATEASREFFGEFVPAGIPGITLYRKEVPAPPEEIVPLRPLPMPPPAVPVRLPDPLPPPRALFGEWPFAAAHWRGGLGAARV